MTVGWNQHPWLDCCAMTSSRVAVSHCDTYRHLCGCLWGPRGPFIWATWFLIRFESFEKHNQMPNWLSHARYLMYQTCASTPFSTASLPLIPSRQSITALIDSGPVKEPVAALCHSAHKLSAVCSDIMGQCSVFTDPTTWLYKKLP